MATLKNTTIESTGTLTLPSGTTAQRPTAAAGMIRANTTNGKMDMYQGSGWDIPVTSGLSLYYDAANKNSYIASSPNTWSDLSGNGRHLTFTRTPVWVGSDGGGCFTFNGVYPNRDSYGSTASSVVGAGSTAHTTSVWVWRTNTSNVSTILSQYVSADTGNFYFLSFAAADQLSFTTSWQNIAFTPFSRVSTWMNLVAVNTGTNAFIYMNGDLVATKGSALTYTGTSGPLVVGRQGATDGEYLLAKLPIVQIYNRALSHAEILQNFNAQRGRFGA